MSYAEANNLLNALEITDIDGNFEIALEVINKYGSYKRAMQASIGIEFKKKAALLIALLGDEEDEKKGEHETEARRLIGLVEAINHKVFEDSQSFGMQFSDLISQIRLDKMLPEKDLAVLNKVKPHCNAQRLISEISTFQDTQVQLRAFIEALGNNRDTLAIESGITNRLRIER